MTYVTDKGNEYDLVNANIVIAVGRIGDIRDKYASGESFLYRGEHYAGIYCGGQEKLFCTMPGQPLVYSQCWHVVDSLGLELACLHSRRDAVTYCEKLVDAGWSGLTFNEDSYLPRGVLRDMLLTL
mgnify:CR=1 FL=1